MTVNEDIRTLVCASFLLVVRENMYRFVETTVYDFSEFQKEREQLCQKKEMSRIEVAQ